VLAACLGGACQRMRRAELVPLSVRGGVVSSRVTSAEGRERTAEFGPLAGVTVAADGSLLFTDDEHGVIYRVAYSDIK